ncbi:MAG: tetratricopeptide repeat protein [Nitrospinota bacterium]|nr:tetratricopeptide repeat protein [Nitrospinota bacterium]
MVNIFSDKNVRHLLFFVLLTSAAIHFLYLWQLKQTVLFTIPYIDAEIYHEWALRINREGWLGQSAFFQSPLYPYILAAIYKIAGPEMGLVLWLQGGLSVTSVWLVYLLGKELFDPRTGLVSATLATFYGTFIFYSGLLLKATLAIFFTCLFLWAVLRANKTPTLRNNLYAGLMLGVAITLRGNFLLVFGAFVFLVFFSSPASIRVRNTLMFFLGVALIIAPITLRNYYLEKDFVLLTYNGGPVFFIGNNPMATGTFAMFNFVRPHPRHEEEDFTARAEKVSGRKLKPSEVSRFWFKVSLAYILEKPRDYLRLQFKKFLLVINDYEKASNYNFYFVKTLAPALNTGFISFGVLLVLGFAGMFLARDRSPSFVAFYLFVLVYASSVVLFHVNARNRLPLVVGLIPFAAFFLLEGVKRISKLAGKQRYALILIIGLTSLGSFRPIQENRFSTSHYHYAIAYRNSGLWEEAAREYKKALAIDPHYSDALSGLAVTYKRLGLLDKAISFHQKTLDTNPNLVQPRMELGSIFLQKGLLEKAQKQYESVLTRHPQSAEPQNYLGIVFEKMGKPDKAILYYNMALQNKPDYAEAHSNLGGVYIAKGLYPKARVELEKALRIKPNLAEVHYNLGIVYAKQGDEDRAQESYQRAFAINPALKRD